MSDPTIRCPNCKSEIKLTESLAAPIVEATKLRYEQQMREHEGELQKRETALQKQKAQLCEAQNALEEQLASRLEAERPKILAEAFKCAKAATASELKMKVHEVAELQQVLRERDAKLAEAQKAQAELLRNKRELEDAKREMDLIVEQRVHKSLEEVREQARKETEDSLRLNLAEKVQTITSMQRQIEDLRRKAEQGSQQTQGEVQELELENLLRTAFPTDIFEPVGKGEFGGDLLQQVIGPHGSNCGRILWESKRTRKWNDGWLSKLRDDQRAAKADMAVLVSQIVPKQLSHFDLIEGVWVAAYPCAVPIAIALRQSLIGIAASRRANEGQQTKMQLIYEYLVGPRFRQRVEAIVERFAIMHEDLDKERKMMTRNWAKREAQIRAVVDATAGMYGDLQGIAGRSIGEIEGLEIHLLEEPELQPM